MPLLDLSGAIPFEVLLNSAMVFPEHPHRRVVTSPAPDADLQRRPPTLQPASRPYPATRQSNHRAKQPLCREI